MMRPAMKVLINQTPTELPQGATVADAVAPTCEEDGVAVVIEGLLAR